MYINITWDFIYFDIKYYLKPQKYLQIDIVFLERIYVSVGGGLFLVVSKLILADPVNKLDSPGEAVWAKIYIV